MRFGPLTKLADSLMYYKYYPGKEVSHAAAYEPDARARGVPRNPRWRVGSYVRFESPLHAGLPAEGPVAGVSG